MNNRTQIIIGCVILLSSFHCTKESSIKTLSPIDQTSKFFEEEKQIFIANTSMDQVSFKAKSGTVIRFSPTDLKTDEGLPYVGDFQLEFCEIRSKEDFFISGIHTTMLDDGTNYSLLKSGGTFKISLKDTKGSSLQNSYPYEITSLVIDWSAGYKSMELFSFDNLEEERLWRPLDSVEARASTLETTEGLYITRSVIRTWLNIDQILKLPSPHFKPTYIYPKGFNDSNSNIYVSLDSLSMSVATSRLPLPFQFPCHAIFMARMEDEFFYAIEPFVVDENSTVDFSKSELITSDGNGFAKAIQRLP